MKLISLLIFMACVIPTILGKELVIAVHKSSPKKSISVKEIKSIFTGEKSQWGDGEDILVVDYKRDTSIKKVFCEKVLKISQVQLYKKWIRASLLGKSSQVILVSNQQEVIDQLKKNPKSVGYLEKDSLPDGVLKKLKVVK